MSNKWGAEICHFGHNAVGYLRESLYGAGSPQAQRIMIQREMEIEFKSELVGVLAGVEQ